MKYYHGLNKHLSVNKLLEETHLCCHNLEVLFISYTKSHCKTLIRP